MPMFIKLKDEDGAEFAINAEMITKIIPGAKDELTEVFLVDEEDALEVEELDGGDFGKGKSRNLGTIAAYRIHAAPGDTNSAALRIGCI